MATYHALDVAWPLTAACRIVSAAITRDARVLAIICNVIRSRSRGRRLATDLRIRKPLVVAVSSQQRGCQARRRCDTREMSSGITVGGA